MTPDNKEKTSNGKFDYLLKKLYQRDRNILIKRGFRVLKSISLKNNCADNHINEDNVCKKRKRNVADTSKPNFARKTKKSSFTKEWSFERKFSNKENARKFLLKDNYWKLDRTRFYKVVEGAKEHYRCNRVKQNEPPCKAEKCLFYHFGSDTVSLYNKNSDNHAHTTSKAEANSNIVTPSEYSTEFIKNENKFKETIVKDKTSSQPKTLNFDTILKEELIIDDEFEPNSMEIGIEEESIFYDSDTTETASETSSSSLYKRESNKHLFNAGKSINKIDHNQWNESNSSETYYSPETGDFDTIGIEELIMKDELESNPKSYESSFYNVQPNYSGQLQISNVFPQPKFPTKRSKTENQFQTVQIDDDVPIEWYLDNTNLSQKDYVPEIRYSDTILKEELIIEDEISSIPLEIDSDSQLRNTADMLRVTKKPVSKYNATNNTLLIPGYTLKGKFANIKDAMHRMRQESDYWEFTCSKRTKCCDGFYMRHYYQCNYERDLATCGSQGLLIEGRNFGGVLCYESSPHFHSISLKENEIAVTEGPSKSVKCTSKIVKTDMENQWRRERSFFDTKIAKDYMQKLDLINFKWATDSRGLKLYYRCKLKSHAIVHCPASCYLQYCTNLSNTILLYTKHIQHMDTCTNADNLTLVSIEDRSTKVTEFADAQHVNISKNELPTPLATINVQPRNGITKVPPVFSMNVQSTNHEDVEHVDMYAKSAPSLAPIKENLTNVISYDKINTAVTKVPIKVVSIKVGGLEDVRHNNVYTKPNLTSSSASSTKEQLTNFTRANVPASLVPIKVQSTKIVVHSDVPQSKICTNARPSIPVPIKIETTKVNNRINAVAQVPIKIQPTKNFGFENVKYDNICTKASTPPLAQTKEQSTNINRTNASAPLVPVKAQPMKVSGLGDIRRFNICTKASTPPLAPTKQQSTNVNRTNASAPLVSVKARPMKVFGLGDIRRVNICTKASTPPLAQTKEQSTNVNRTNASTPLVPVKAWPMQVSGLGDIRRVNICTKASTPPLAPTKEQSTNVNRTNASTPLVPVKAWPMQVSGLGDIRRVNICTKASTPPLAETKEQSTNVNCTNASAPPVPVKARPMKVSGLGDIRRVNICTKASTPPLAETKEQSTNVNRTNASAPPVPVKARPMKVCGLGDIRRVNICTKASTPPLAQTKEQSTNCTNAAAPPVPVKAWPMKVSGLGDIRRVNICTKAGPPTPGPMKKQMLNADDRLVPIKVKSITNSTGPPSPALTKQNTTNVIDLVDSDDNDLNMVESIPKSVYRPNKTKDTSSMQSHKPSGAILKEVGIKESCGLVKMQPTKLTGFEDVRHVNICTKARVAPPDSIKKQVTILANNHRTNGATRLIPIKVKSMTFFGPGAAQFANISTKNPGSSYSIKRQLPSLDLTNAAPSRVQRKVQSTGIMGGFFPPDLIKELWQCKSLEMEWCGNSVSIERNSF